MEDAPQINAVSFNDVEFSTQGITLSSHQSKLLSVSKEDIRKITLKYGFQSERPILEIIFGFAVIGAGLYFFANFILEALIHRLIYLEDLLSLSLLPIGIWFIIDGFRKRLYFEVALDNDIRKFPLRKSPDKNELQKFIEIAAQLGYAVDTTLLDNKFLN